MADRTILVDGFSKAYAMTGWRLGFAIVNRTLAGLLDTFIANVHSCTATFTQYAGIEALTGPQHEVEKMRLKLLKRRDLMVTELNHIPGFRCHMPPGAFYAFPNVTEACQIAGLADADQLQDALLELAGVAVLSMTAFHGPRDPKADQYIRSVRRYRQQGDPRRHAADPRLHVRSNRAAAPPQLTVQPRPTRPAQTSPGSENACTPSATSARSCLSVHYAA